MPLPRSPQLTVAQQAFNLRASPIAVAGQGGMYRGRLRWDFEVQPSVASRSYSVRLEYAADETPSVYVRHPDLVSLAEQRRLPHVYSQRPVRLCLYLPGTGQWHRGMSLAATVVPWTYLWFAYFEEWLVTGEWTGGGEHPEEEPPRLCKQRRGRCIGQRKSHV